MQLKVPIRFTWMTKVKDPRSCGPRLPCVFSAIATPAQFTSPWIAPNRAAAASIAAPTSSALVTSQGAKRAFDPRSSATWAPAERSRSRMATRPP